MVQKNVRFQDFTFKCVLTFIPISCYIVFCAALLPTLSKYPDFDCEFAHFSTFEYRTYVSAIHVLGTRKLTRVMMATEYRTVDHGLNIRQVHYSDPACTQMTVCYLPRLKYRDDPEY